MLNNEIIILLHYTKHEILTTRFHRTYPNLATQTQQKFGV
jgi:hypothetical protein